MNGVNERKEEQAKSKNARLMAEIKRFERRNKELKDRINKSLMLQIQAGSMPGLEQMPALQQLLMMNEGEEVGSVDSFEDDDDY